MSMSIATFMFGATSIAAVKSRVKPSDKNGRAGAACIRPFPSQVSPKQIGQTMPGLPVWRRLLFAM
jgi:hypothetical protein